METTNSSALFELSIDHESIQHLTETARWGKFLAIVGFIVCGLMVILAFFMGSILANSLSFLPTNQSSGVNAASAIGGAFFTGIYLFFAAAYFFPCLFLYQYSVRLRAALRSNDQEKLNQSLKSQKLLFRYVGILTIILLAIYGMALLFIGVAAVISRT